MNTTSQDESEILFEIRDQIGHVTFNRPAARNALTFRMYERLAQICARAESVGLLALILKGAGGKAFAAGTDINQFRAFNTPEDALAYEARIDNVISAIESCPVPIIAAITGACTGGGATIAAVCDIRVAAEDARFGFPIAKTLGNCLSIENYARLAGLIGAARVKELIFSARLIDAAEAKTIGLISETLPDNDATLARAEEIARTIKEHAPLTLRVTKEALRRISQATRISAPDLILSCYMSHDFREGMDAFLTKRKPNWLGR